MHKPPTVFGNSRMPLYLQVAALMRQKIASQQWRVGEQIPTLEALEKEYRVSRITLRASLDQLEQQGVVKRTRGLGTFVLKDLSEERWFKLAGSFEELVSATRGLKIKLLHLDRKELPLVPAIACGEVAKAYQRIRRVHYHNDTPYCLIEIYLEKTLYQQDPTAFDTATVVPQLAELPGLKLSAGKQVMRVTASDAETAGHLNIGIGDPVADVCRALVDQHGRLVYYAHIQYPAQMIEVETDLFPAKPSAARGRGKKKSDMETL
jgi:GntR family transcriptional regulator